MHAELSLRFIRKEAATSFRCLRQDSPWKVVRGFPQEDSGTLVHLNNVSGGILGGDCLRMVADIGPHAEAQVTTTGASRMYRPRPENRDAQLTNIFHVGEGAVLEYLPDALIPFRDARVYQQTTYRLEQDASLFCWEVIAPGRVAAGEIFEYERLRLVTDVYVSGEPLLKDRLFLQPRQFCPQSKSVAGTYRYLVTFLAIRVGASASEVQELEERLNQAVKPPLSECGERSDYWGVTTMPAHGLVVRGLLSSTATLPDILHTLWSVSKLAFLARKPVVPRKTY